MTAVVLIDGGYLRALRKVHTITVDAVLDVVNHIHSLIEQQLCLHDERIRWIRTYYYDTEPFEGNLRQPDGKLVDLSKTHGASIQRRLLTELQYQNQFAVRKGVIKFRAWETTQSGYRPIFQQKGVDMKIGLDIAWPVTPISS